jgi:hypothetical protein
MVCVRKGEEAMITSAYKPEWAKAAGLFVDLLKLGPSSPLFETLNALDEEKRWAAVGIGSYRMIFGVAINCDVEVQLREPGSIVEVNSTEVWGATWLAVYTPKVRVVKLGKLLLTVKVTSSREVTMHFNEDGESQLERSRYDELTRFLERGLGVNLKEVTPLQPSRCTSIVVYTGPNLDDYLAGIGKRGHLTLLRSA